MHTNLLKSGLNRHRAWGFMLLIVTLLMLPKLSFGQLDEGAITGMVTDPQGMPVANAGVQLTNTGTGLVITTKTDGSGVYTFQPIKVGAYSVTVTASGFATTTLNGLQLHVADRLEANVQLQVGTVTQTMQVNASAAPLLQTEEASSGQTIATQTINDVPLNGRNYVFIAQESAGVPPSNQPNRGQGNGSFTANGMRASQNNFILDGVDNNSNSIDFLNGASYVVKPPPDALEEFKVQTGSFSAEFGHSAGAVVNASIKSGTNRFNGDVWEYVRNNDLGEASPTEWSSGVNHPTTVLPYHQNQFGFTFGGPILRNKLFFFGDYEGTRIAQSAPQVLAVPTPLERSGNFTELLNTHLTGFAQPVNLYEPGSAGNQLLGSSCGNGQNIMCANEIDSIASKLLSLYPLPNANNGATYNNYATALSTTDNTNQFDVRVDYNPSASDQVFARVSQNRESKYVQSPYGPILDGGSTLGDGTFIDNTDNGLISENHIFSPSLINQARISYTWGYFNWVQENANVNLDATYGLGGIPYQPGNGGLPTMQIGGLNYGDGGYYAIGGPLFSPSPEHQNGYQLIDDLTWIHKNHSFKFGAEFHNIRFAMLQPLYPRTFPTFTGVFTGKPGVAYTGFGVADFLADQMNTDNSSSYLQTNMGRWYRSAYSQDDWRLSRKLTVNFGLRWDFAQPSVERDDKAANFVTTGTAGAPGTGQAEYMLPSSQKGVTLNPAFLVQAAADNVSIVYSGNRSLVNSQKTDFAPRIGASYQATNHLVTRFGSGVFFGGLENDINRLGLNYPYDLELFWAAPSCSAGATSCANDGGSLENGPPAGGFNPFGIGLNSVNANLKSSYSIEYNLSAEYALSNSTSLTLAYVGSVARHLYVNRQINQSTAIAPSGTNTQSLQPFPHFGSVSNTNAEAVSSYNSLQATFQRHFNNGLSYLTTYTWSHSLDDAQEPLPSAGDSGYKNTTMFPESEEYSDSPFDVRQRFTFVGDYDLPFGVGRKYMQKPGLVDMLAGGWSASMLFNAQTGQPFTVSAIGAISPTTGNVVGGVAGSGTFAIKLGDPFKSGGPAPAGNPGVTCAPKTKTTANWFNPCQFANPAYPSSFGSTGYITAAQGALAYTGGRREQMQEPGFERINMSVFKNFKTFESQFLQFRADVFNLFNTPAWGAPSDTNIGGVNSGQITSTRFVQNYSPDQRFIQLALKYYF